MSSPVADGAPGRSPIAKHDAGEATLET
jgi:hypothetical protein